ncbi:MAG: HlyD family efflux transporter periplasmic adaptor subunit [Pirellulaceae bacterium]|nr:HlyD family efflux transporter periplasmic adaptor subunit [Pirellulaceae bacterium]
MAISTLFRKPRRRFGRIWLVLLILILVPIAGVWGWMHFFGGSFFGTQDDDRPMTEVVIRGPFDHIVLEQGEIESSSNNEVKCAVKSRGSSGTPILSVLPEGTLVKKGDPICQLDSSALEDEFKSQRIVVSNAEALVISSDAALRQAEIARQEYLEGTYLTERKAILSEIALNQQALRTTELSLSSAERLAAKGTLKSLQIEAEQFSVLNARNNLDAAQGRLRVLDELTKAKMLVQFDSTIETAKAKLSSDQSTLEEAKDQLETVKSLIDACNIRAPADGQVVHANRYSSRGGSAEFVVEAGSMVREQQTIILLPDPTKMQVKARVNESRVTLLKEGMPVRIRVGAVTNELDGRVIKVNKYAEPGGFFSSSVKEYATYIQIIDPPPTIRTGMTAEVRIFVEQIPQALQIPVHAIYETKGHHFALKEKPDNQWETVEVKIGATNEMFVTIDQGLSENDTVVLNPRSHLDKMKIPEIEDVADRERLAKIADEKIEVVKDAGSSKGSGGNPAAAVAAIFQRVDTDSDGKISKEEAAVDERMASAFAGNDKNGDGSIDKAEMLTSISQRSGKSGKGKGSGGGDGPGEGGGGARDSEGGGPRSAEGT